MIPEDGTYEQLKACIEEAVFPVRGELWVVYAPKSNFQAALDHEYGNQGPVRWPAYRLNARQVAIDKGEGKKLTVERGIWELLVSKGMAHWFSFSV